MNIALLLNAYFNRTVFEFKSRYRSVNNQVTLGVW